MNIKRIRLAMIVTAISVMTLHAQISLGSKSDPNEGALLSLRQNDNLGENSNCGLMLPRVNLKTKQELYPMFEEDDPLYTENEKTLHTGLVVYNLTTDSSEDLCPGPYTWNGNEWERLWESCIPPFSIECGNTYTTGYVGIDLISTSATSTVKIPYKLSSGSYELTGGNIGTYGGVIAYIEAQTLTAPSGDIIVKFSGTPSAVMDKALFPIKVAGNTCSIYLSVMYPPAYCTGGSEARGFVFEQNGKWYVVTINKSSSADAIVRTIECKSEEEALRHPEALQYCGVQATNRCIPLFDRNGEYQGVIFKVDTSSQLAQSTTVVRCWENFKVSSGSRIQSISTPTGYLGAVNVTNGKGSLGLTSQIATMTTKALR